MEDVEQRVHRVGVGLVELVPDEVPDRGLITLMENLSDRVCALLLAVVVAAQLADVVTTFRALSLSHYVENNPLLRELMVRAPGAAYSVKLLSITAMVLVVLSRLRGGQARAALAVAGIISLVAPVLNFTLLSRG